ASTAQTATLAADGFDGIEPILSPGANPIRQQRNSQCIGVGAVVVEEGFVILIDEKRPRSRMDERGVELRLRKRTAGRGSHAERLPFGERQPVRHLAPGTAAFAAHPDLLAQRFEAAGRKAHFAAPRESGRPAVY